MKLDPILGAQFEPDWEQVVLANFLNGISGKVKDGDIARGNVLEKLADLPQQSIGIDVDLQRHSKLVCPEHLRERTRAFGR